MANVKKNIKVRGTDVLQQADIAGIFGVSKTKISMWNSTGLIVSYRVEDVIRFAIKFGRGEVKLKTKGGHNV